jgi:hypothetical protein
MKKLLSKNNFLLRTAMAVLIFVAPATGVCQVLTVVTPITNQTYKLPDPASIQTADDTRAAIASAETAGKALIADANTEKKLVAAEQNSYNTAETEKNDYIKAANDFSKNDVDPYKLDLNNYTATGTKFMQLLTKHNNAVKANNALPAKKRKAATVAALTKEKLHIDSMATQLTKWKTKLDAAKSKLDVKNAALQKQQQKYEPAEQAATLKLKPAKVALTNIVNQLNQCANYAAKYKSVLTAKSTSGATPVTGYFESAEYKSTVADLNNQLTNLRAF